MSASGSDIAEALQSVADRISDGMSEKDVENAFLNEQFYSLLGYEGAGHDLRSEMTLPDNRRPDYITLDSNDGVTVVYEFKAPGRNLAEHTDQLFHYTEVLKADYGILTNGESFRWYKREGRTRMDDVSMSRATDKQGSDIYAALRKPEWDIRNPEHVHDYIESITVEGVGLDTELGQEHFFDTFRLEEGSPFAELVTGLMGMLKELRDQPDNQFVTSAYAFWEATYASEPNETPESWEPFIDGDQSLNDFMFCLESAHALLARLLLAKATEDHDFFQQTAYGGMHEYFEGLQGFGTEINLDAYPVGAVDLVTDMRDQLVESLFEDDIFTWWTDAYEQHRTTQHQSGAARFESIAKGDTSIEGVSVATQERFSRAVAHVFFNVLRFDFTDAEGDLLGDLYQRYFDPETRKALGEFYTPQPVIDFIMDGVDYNRGVSNHRLIDPACGSGTFLVEAVQRYIDDVEYYNDNPDWETHLKNLCAKPRVVGLDIHPFAVLMAQIRFVVAILPAYREAKRRNPGFTLSRIPIYRTDTLRNERELTGVDIGSDDGSMQVTFDALTEDSQDVLIPTPLPIQTGGEEELPSNVEIQDGFLVPWIRMPKFDTIRLNTRIGNFDEYFAALQGVIDTVKQHLRADEESDLDFDWRYHSGLENNIHRYTSQQYDGVEEFFEPYVNDMLEHVRYLKEEHDDGRLFKMLEDAVLSLVVKNYMEYDYVVGNPPYVRKESIPIDQKRLLEKLYPEAYSGNTDLSVYFLSRGLNLLAEDGKLGFITSIKFTRSAYGEGIRNKIKRESKILEFSNFEMSNFFEDATAYPCVVVLQNSPQAADYDIDVAYGKNRPPADQVDEVVQNIRHQIHQKDRYTGEHFATFKTSSSDLIGREWSFTPKESNAVFRKLNDLAEFRLEEVVGDISAGIKTGKNSVFILEDEKAKALNIEDELLKPIYRGSEIERYKVGDPSESVIYTNGIDIDDFPNAKEYLLQYKDELANRQDATFKNRDKAWYELNIPHSPEELEQDKIICREISLRSNFALDEHGRYILNKVYFFSPKDEYSDYIEHLLGLLNSSTLEFYVKMTSTPLQNGYYQFFTRYLEPLPVVLDDPISNEISQTVGEIREHIDLRNKIDGFPERYVEEYHDAVDYIEYKWESRRYPVESEISEDDEGNILVEAGRTDSITDPAMYADDINDRKRRGKYVHAAVNGRNVKEGETTTIPIPRSNAGVQELLEQYQTDQDVVNSTDLAELEDRIDSLVYDLFSITDDEQDVIEEYLKVF